MTEQARTPEAQSGIELVQVPAQPLLAAASFVDQVITVVDEELELAQRLFVVARPFEARLLERGTCDRERVDRVRLAAYAAAPALWCGQPRRHTDQPLAGIDEPSLECARDMATVFERPRPVAIQR